MLCDYDVKCTVISTSVDNNTKELTIKLRCVSAPGTFKWSYPFGDTWDIFTVDCDETVHYIHPPNSINITQNK